MEKTVETIAISTFKATCLAVLERVRRTGQRVIVTRHGEPIAEILPPTPPGVSAGWLGAMRDHGHIAGDIVTPAVDAGDWEVIGT